MAKATNEIGGIVAPWKGAAASVKKLFDPTERAMRKAERKATAEALEAAKPELEAAQKGVAEARVAAATAKAKTAAAETIAKIGAAEEPVAKAAAGAARKSAWGIPFRASTKVGTWIVEQPVAFALKPVKWVSGGLANAVEKSPKLAIAAAAGATVVGIGSVIAKHNAKKLQTQNDVAEQLQAIQAAAPRQVSYMNSASQADVDAVIAANRPSSQAAALAARSAAPEASSPAV